MTRGRWVVLVILLVAVGVGLASWPLMRLRRKDEIHKTKVLMESLMASIEQYSSRHGAYPRTLQPFGEVRDAWGRPFRYGYVVGETPQGNVWSATLTSLGPDPDDPSDDFSLTR